MPENGPYGNATPSAQPAIVPLDMTPDDQAYFERMREHGKQTGARPWAPRPLDGVYFVQVGDDGPVKIGHAADVRNRLAALQSGNPMRLHLRHVIEGCRAERQALERELHQKYADFRIFGEWYAPEPIEEIRVGHNA